MAVYDPTYSSPLYGGGFNQPLQGGFNQGSFYMGQQTQPMSFAPVASQSQQTQQAQLVLAH